MKAIVLIMTIFLSSTAFAAVENWFPLGKEGAKTVYMKKIDCESAESQKCWDITGKSRFYHKPGFEPISVEETTDCEDASSCSMINMLCEKGSSLKWDEKSNWPNLDFSPRPSEGWFMWCEKQTLTVDVQLKNAYETKVASQKAKESAISKELTMQKCGDRILAMVRIKNKLKGLSKVQRKAMKGSFKNIASDINEGNLDLARDDVEAIVADGTVITESDKSEILSEIDNCLAQ